MLTTHVKRLPTQGTNGCNDSADLHVDTSQPRSTHWRRVVPS